MDSHPILQVRNLTTKLLIEGKAFTAVDHLFFDLYKGKTLALVGESGCGKTMTALSLMQILPMPPALFPEGEVLYRGRDLLKLTENEMRGLRGFKIAMIFQDPLSALNPVYTIGEQLLEVVITHLKVNRHEAEKRVLHALADVQLADPAQRMKEYPHQLSGGMLQRAMIAMALLCEPDLLIADEPTTALDVTIQAQILGLLTDLQKRKGMAILLITHDMGVVAEMAHDVIVMYATQKVEQGDVFAVFDAPAHPYTQGLFASVPSRPIRQGRFPTIKGFVPPLTALPSGCFFHPRCPYAMPICLEGAVPEFPLSQPGHFAKCWLYDPDLEYKMVSTDEKRDSV